MKKITARLISNIFNPIIEIGFVVWLATSLNITFVNPIVILFISLFFLFLLPLGVFVFSLKTKRISDIDVTKRKERYGFNIAAVFCIAACLLVFYFLGEINLIYFYLKLMLPFFIYVIITFFWKISSHMLVNSIFILLLYFYLDNPVVLYLGLILLILVGWSRIRLKKHTLSQVIAGGLLSLVSLL